MATQQQEGHNVIPAPVPGPAADGNAAEAISVVICLLVAAAAHRSLLQGRSLHVRHEWLHVQVPTFYLGPVSRTYSTGHQRPSSRRPLSKELHCRATNGLRCANMAKILKGRYRDVMTV